MKYAVDFRFKGIAMDVNVKAQNKGDMPIDAVVNMPGDVEVKVTGECGFWETFMYFSFIGDMLKALK